ncbi:MAG: polyprenyl diphosphate synthase [Candidatus Saccharimonadales bacterium]
MAAAQQPKHVAIIPDGNTRWANANGVSSFEGYKQGAERGLEIMRHSREIGVHTLTFWGLSTENWRNRPEGELTFLVDLFGSMIDRYLEEALKHNVRVVHLGNTANLPASLIDKLAAAAKQTKANDAHVLNLALDYGGHDELLRATEAIARDIAQDKVSLAELSQPLPGVAKSDGPVPTVFARYLDTHDQPYPFPDFIIRTSGEMRTSGFMPWQAVYAELYFEPVFWPDFTAEKFDAALREYQTRQRRFGGGHDEEPTG